MKGEEREKRRARECKEKRTEERRSDGEWKRLRAGAGGGDEGRASERKRREVRGEREKRADATASVFFSFPLYSSPPAGDATPLDAAPSVTLAPSLPMSVWMRSASGCSSFDSISLNSDTK